MLLDLHKLPEEEVYKKYSFSATKDWRVEDKKSLFKINDTENIIPIEYRQFDKRYSYYPLDKIQEIIVRGDSRRSLMQHYIFGENVGLIIGRQGQVVGDMQWNLAFIADHPTDMNIFYRGGGINFPLYLYDDSKQISIDHNASRTVNINRQIINKFAFVTNLEFIDEKKENKNTFSPIDLLDYIYAILYSPTYREKYKEFLKIDFPRIPYPKDVTSFWQYVKFGSELRKFHLMEHENSESFITTYPKDGNNVVNRKMTANSIGFELVDKKSNTGKVWINDEQYFDGVPLAAWEFYIGGYQPAQKWLKDRHGRELDFDDILHYQKIIVALVETRRLMREIDKIVIE